jgi:hypothetical protein
MVVKQHDPVTLAEARRMGMAAQRYENLRHCLKEMTGGGITVQTRNGSIGLSLYSLDMEALLALLIEREGQYLASMGVMLEEPPL